MFLVVSVHHNVSIIASLFPLAPFTIHPGLLLPFKCLKYHIGIQNLIERSLPPDPFGSGMEASESENFPPRKLMVHGCKCAESPARAGGKDGLQCSY